jgi:hypothetical protein
VSKNKITLLLSLLFLSAGCLHPHRLGRGPMPLLPDIRVPMHCVNRDVILKRCNTTFSPPHCATSVVNYVPGCEIVVVKQ